MVQNVAKNGKSFLGSNNGHVWAEVRDEDTLQRIRIDATPTIKEDGEKSKENGQEQDKEQKENNQEADNNFDEDQEN